jgi:superfamily II DNA or RNA helicase
VLSDATFGELWVDGSRPERGQHVFASVQSLSEAGISGIPKDASDVSVIDEFHHAQAASYRRLLDHFAPIELLGLTATPERGDGVDVRAFFDGRTVAELRLWDALDQNLLCPFHYFGIHDGTDLSRMAWSRGAYDPAALDGPHTGNDASALERRLAAMLFFSLCPDGGPFPHIEAGLDVSALTFARPAKRRRPPSPGARPWVATRALPPDILSVGRPEC